MRQILVPDDARILGETRVSHHLPFGPSSTAFPDSPERTVVQTLALRHSPPSFRFLVVPFSLWHAGCFTP